jgi:hypothetical protein
MIGLEFSDDFGRHGVHYIGNDRYGCHRNHAVINEIQRIAINGFSRLLAIIQKEQNIVPSLAQGQKQG